MANKEHLKILRRGVEVWNAWREEHPDRPDLASADLASADLGGADLVDADLEGADLVGADLRDANLAGAEQLGKAKIGDIGIEILPAQEMARRQLDWIADEGHVFDMTTWWKTNCQTTGCAAGIAVEVTPGGRKWLGTQGYGSAALLAPALADLLYASNETMLKRLHELAGAG